MLEKLLGCTCVAAILAISSVCNTVEAEEADATSPDSSLWLSQAEIDALPTEGESFDNVVSRANLGLRADISDQDNRHDSQTYAAALLCARGVGQAYCEQAEQGIRDAIGTEGSEEDDDARTLALGRNLLAYVLAADLIDYRDPDFMSWLDAVRHKDLSGRTLISTHEDRPNNWGTVSGASRIAASYYLGDEADVEAAAQVFHGYLGNRGAYADFKYGLLHWQADPAAPVGINPPGATKEGHDIDGVLPEEMRRCGSGDFLWPPCRTGYTWGGLQGAVMQAELLTRLGYPAWEWESRALLRAVTWLHETTFDDGKNAPAEGVMGWQPWLINYAYGTDFPAERAPQPGRTMGFTDWTHGGRTAR